MPYHNHKELFLEIPIGVRIISCVMFIIASVIGIVGNTFIVATFCRNRSLRLRHALSINLAAIETLLPLSSYWMPVTSYSNSSWILGELGCTLYGFFNCFFAMSAVATVASKALCSLIETFQPHRYRRNKANLLRLRVSLCGVSWLYGLIFATPPLFGWGHYVLEGFQMSCSFDYISKDPQDIMFMTLLMFGGFVYPAVTICFCYGKIYCSMIDLTRYKRTTGESRIVRLGVSIRRIPPRKIRRLMLTAALNPHFLCWIPYVAVVLYAHFIGGISTNSYSIWASALIAKSAVIFGLVTHSDELVSKLEAVVKESVTTANNVNPTERATKASVCVNILIPVSTDVVQNAGETSVTRME